MFVDADDKLPEGAVESLMRSALRTDADIVEGGYTALWENVRLLLSGIRRVLPGIGAYCMDSRWGKFISLGCLRTWFFHWAIGLRIQSVFIFSIRVARL